MEDNDDDIDVAAAMGFSAFGSTKKRKYENAHSPKPKANASGANATGLGVRTKTVAGAEETGAGGSHTGLLAPGEPNDSQDASIAPTHPASPARNQPPSEPDNVLDSEQTESLSFGGPPISRSDLEALRFGVKDSNGDTAYFLPSFVEDPWGKFPTGSSS